METQELMNRIQSVRAQSMHSSAAELKELGTLYFEACSALMMRMRDYEQVIRSRSIANPLSFLVTLESALQEYRTLDLHGNADWLEILHFLGFSETSALDAELYALLKNAVEHIRRRMLMRNLEKLQMDAAEMTDSSEMTDSAETSDRFSVSASETASADVPDAASEFPYTASEPPYTASEPPYGASENPYGTVPEAAVENCVENLSEKRYEVPVKSVPEQISYACGKPGEVLPPALPQNFPAGVSSDAAPRSVSPPPLPEKRRSSVLPPEISSAAQEPSAALKDAFASLAAALEITAEAQKNEKKENLDKKEEKSEGFRSFFGKKQKKETASADAAASHSADSAAPCSSDAAAVPSGAGSAADLNEGADLLAVFSAEAASAASGVSSEIRSDTHSGAYSGAYSGSDSGSGTALPPDFSNASGSLPIPECAVAAPPRPGEPYPQPYSQSEISPGVSQGISQGISQAASPEKAVSGKKTPQTSVAFHEWLESDVRNRLISVLIIIIIVQLLIILILSIILVRGWSFMIF